MESAEGARYKHTAKLALRLMILDRARRDCPTAPFTAEVVEGMRKGLGNLRDLYFPAVGKLDLVKKVGQLGFCSVGAAVFSYAAIGNDTAVGNGAMDPTALGNATALENVTALESGESETINVTVGPIKVSPQMFFGTSASILSAMALNQAHELFHVIYPLWNISGQALERVVAEQMGNTPEQKSGCLAKVTCLNEVPSCSPCLFMTAKGQSASNDVAGNKDNSNGTREEREELQMVTSL
ncbi:hypothetical protein Psal006b_02684 [Piscirickettsia salmonis]|uniref:DNA-directed RNA polymerase subunit beta n=4 Tax=Piscirickettsia salmonis TaxID=1238 RepID=A0A1L6TH09_PISSA|nr:hypothetical protein [Piscirickettsia salmonis]AKP73067.1 hypothetical protein PSLF89_1032 [Piscirickettsia salmonis LF-89 = ATCC VR-1361]ALB21715.1 DNA-directed RNA polymerase subunit beta [Piscirickettsia salmonis]ALY01912.1 hypothetical protein AWE47_02690 [Piscirickettsia salmonis]AMA41420.1 hypothetical protein AWJ11_02675 [Piscirickettsia salmonis]APS61305.1 hypothetical protein AVI53_12615 [Piscirickettsia salmonis]